MHGNSDAKKIENWNTKNSSKSRSKKELENILSQKILTKKNINVSTKIGCVKNGPNDHKMNTKSGEKLSKTLKKFKNCAKIQKVKKKMPN